MKLRQSIFGTILLVSVFVTGSYAEAGGPLNVVDCQQGPGTNYTIGQDAPYLKGFGLAPWKISEGHAPYTKSCGAAPYIRSKGSAAYIKRACEAPVILSHGEAPYKKSSGTAPVSLRLKGAPCP